MNFDPGEVLSRTWQITWKHKVLWVYGFLQTLASFLIFPLVFIPAFAPLMFNRSEELGRIAREPWFFLIFIPASFPFFWRLPGLKLLFTEDFNRTILVIAGLWATVYLPLFAVFQGAMLALMKVGWILTYLRLTRSPNLHPLQGTVEATL